MMKDIALNPDTWDIELDGRDQRLISGSEAYAQRLRIKLGHICGEWYLDTSGGGSNLAMLGAKSPDLNLYSGIMRGVIERDQDTVKILTFSIKHDKKARVLNVIFEVESVYGILRRSEVVA